MARYTGPITKKSRRLKMDLVGGDKHFALRPFPPGQHGRRRIQEKEYLTQLQEQQKARFTYGVMEKQFRRYYKEAANRPGKTGENILTILESRLDNVVYRAGLARTRRMSRQLVTHGHFLVNGVRVDVPSYRVEQYDIITVRKQSVETLPLQLARETFGDRPIPAWMQVVPGSLQILIHRMPSAHPSGRRPASGPHHVQRWGGHRATHPAFTRRHMAVARGKEEPPCSSHSVPSSPRTSSPSPGAVSSSSRSSLASATRSATRCVAPCSRASRVRP